MCTIILKIVSNNGPVSFGDKFYTRMGANTNPEPVGINDLPQFIKKIQKLIREIIINSWNRKILFMIIRSTIKNKIRSQMNGGVGR